MATIITSECINCGACEPECPNTAIYAGGVDWDLNGVTSPPVAQDIFYIVPSKCTECVGFYDHEACAAVCPVDCCVPDPNNLESEQVLLQRAAVLHPEQTFAADAPSRFRKEGGELRASRAHKRCSSGGRSGAGRGSLPPRRRNLRLPRPRPNQRRRWRLRRPDNRRRNSTCPRTWERCRAQSVKSTSPANWKGISTRSWDGSISSRCRLRRFRFRSRCAWENRCWARCPIKSSASSRRRWVIRWPSHGRARPRSTLSSI